MSIKEPLDGKGIQPSFTMIDQPPTQQTIKAHVLAQTITTSVASNYKENPNTKPRIDKCYRYGEPGHRSNECPKRKLLTI